MLRTLLFCVALVVAVTSNLGAIAAESLSVLPVELLLTGPEARHRLIVEAARDGHAVGQVADGVVFESSNDKVAKVENGFVIPVGNGHAVITAKVGGQSASTKITVEKF